MSTNINYSLHQLVSKLKSPDADFRYMALSDLSSIIKSKFNGSNTESSSIKNVIQVSIISSLSDTNVEVQNMSIKCLDALIPTLSPLDYSFMLKEILNIFKKANQLPSTSPNKALTMSISTTALRTAIISRNSKDTYNKYSTLDSGNSSTNLSHKNTRDLNVKDLNAQAIHAHNSNGPSSSGDPIIITITDFVIPTILPYANSSVDVSDILITIISKYGAFFDDNTISKIQSVLLDILQKGKGITRKRAINALGLLCQFSSQDSIKKIKTFISSALLEFTNKNNLNKSRSTDYQYLSIITQFIAILFKYITSDIVSILPEIIAIFFPILYSNTSNYNDNDSSSQNNNGDYNHSEYDNDEDDDEIIQVKETILNALDSIVSSSPKDVSMYSTQILEISKKYLVFDPNYFYNDEDDDEDEENEMNLDSKTDTSENELDEDSYGYEDGYDIDAFDDVDNDDSSWKLRKASARLVACVSQNLPCFSSFIVKNILSTMLKKLSIERDESVKSEFLNSLIIIIHSIQVNFLTLQTSFNNSSSFGQSLLKRKKSDESMRDINESNNHNNNNIVQLLLDCKPSLTFVISKELKVSSQRQTIQDQLIINKSLLISLLSELISVVQITPEVADLFSTLQLIFNSIPNLRVEILTLIVSLDFKNPSSVPIQNYINHIVSMVISGIDDTFYKTSAKALQTLIIVIEKVPNKAVLKPYADKLYGSVMSRLSVADVDIDVRDQAVETIGALINSDILSKETLDNATQLLLKKLQSEITSYVALKSIELIASTQKVDLSAKWVNEVVLSSLNFVNKSNRSLRTAAGNVLSILTKNYSVLDSQTSAALLKSFTPLLNSTDISQLTTTLVIIKNIDKKLLAEDSNLLEHLLTLSFSSIANSVLSVSNEIVEIIAVFAQEYATISNAKSLELLNMFKLKLTKPSRLIPKLVAVIILKANLHNEVNEFVNIAQTAFSLNSTSKVSQEAIKSINCSLLVLSQIGQRANLDIKMDWLLKLFDTPVDGIRFSAANAFGAISVGKGASVLSLLISDLQSSKNHIYLDFLAFKECFTVINEIKNLLEKENTNSYYLISTSCFDSNEAKEVIDSIWNYVFTNLLLSSKSNEQQDIKLAAAECTGSICTLYPSVYLEKLKSILKKISIEVLNNGKVIKEEDSFGTCASISLATVPNVITNSSQKYNDSLIDIIGIVLDILKAASSLDSVFLEKLSLNVLKTVIHNKPYLAANYINRLMETLCSKTIIIPGLIQEVQIGIYKHKVDHGLSNRKSAYETLYSVLNAYVFSTELSTDYGNGNGKMNSGNSIMANLQIGVGGVSNGSENELLTQMRTISRLDLRLDAVLLCALGGLSDDHDIRLLSLLIIEKIVNISPELFCFSASVEKGKEVPIILEKFGEISKKLFSPKLTEKSIKQEYEKNQEVQRILLKTIATVNEKISLMYNPVSFVTLGINLKHEQFQEAVSVWNSVFEEINSKQDNSK